jgi:hypothetical protein
MHVDGRHIELRQCFMGHAPASKVCTDSFGGDIFVKYNPYMIEFAANVFVRFRPSVSLLRFTNHINNHEIHTCLFYYTRDGVWRGDSVVESPG